jgi:hypothetical protein
MDPAHRKQVNDEASRLAQGTSVLSDEGKILLAILAALEGIDYKLYKAEQRGKAT